ncbi:P-loop containing nucleoside triphosphate hydrolase protein [Xylariaceae sp. FL0016]|nr:P-loop containing nucleoside triphosphate hydrolase protein [Xylariaceae sp. FL0016]
MDVAKLLSRGTKKSTSQILTPKPAPVRSNPQLYGQGLKRKRNEEEPQQEATGDDLDVDFFAPPAAKPAPQPVAKQPLPKEDLTAKCIDEQEVRQILRSHRLKFTVLSTHDEQKAKVRKSKKKKKESTKSKAKDAKKPIFPQPLQSFSELRSSYNVSARLSENLAKQGYRIPTEIQIGSLPLLLRAERAISEGDKEDYDLEIHDGVNFLGIAPTGSGKTLAFLIPAINDVLRRRAEGTKDHQLNTVIVVPTRELAYQISSEGMKLTQGLGVKIVNMKKGMQLPAEGRARDVEEPELNEDSDIDDDSEDQDSQDSEDDEAVTKSTITKADILVTTPMFLLNSLKSRALPSVRTLVLDEADALLESGMFRDQTIGIWSACTNPGLRLVAFSATMASDVESMLAERLKSQDPEGTCAPLVRLVVGLKDTAVPLVKHKLVYTATEQGKLYALRQLLHPKSSDDWMSSLRYPYLIFAQTIERATSLHNELMYDFPVEAGGSTRIAALHSSLPESVRSNIVARFRSGEIWVLITTDLSMRGLDFKGVQVVANYDIPSTAAAYVHRVGRTGRAGYEGGIAVTFYTTEDVAHLKSIANVISLSEKQAGKDGDEGVPKWLLESLPKASKEEKKKLKKRGVESRRGDKSKITSKSAWERRKENNRRGAIEGSKRRKAMGIGKDDAQRRGAQGDSEWSGIDD